MNKARILSEIVFLLLAGFFLWWFRYWPEQRVAEHFFDALEKQDYESAYGIWMQDPQWRQHPDRYKKYLFHEFYTDWGPGGQWGVVKSYKIYGAGAPPVCGRGVDFDLMGDGRACEA